VSAVRPLLTGLTLRRPFTILGILLALLVIAAFVLVALNAQNATSSPPHERGRGDPGTLQPRLPIDPASLELRSIPVPGTYPKVFFTRIQDVQGMIPLVTIQSGQAVTANDRGQAEPGAGLAVGIPTDSDRLCRLDHPHERAAGRRRLHTEGRLHLSHRHRLNLG